MLALEVWYVHDCTLSGIPNYVAPATLSFDNKNVISFLIGTVMNQLRQAAARSRDSGDSARKCKHTNYTISRKKN